MVQQKAAVHQAIAHLVMVCFCIEKWSVAVEV